MIRSKMIPIDEPLETAELLAFVRIVDARSLTRAAAELRVPRATVGRRLSRLEQRLGTRLLRRTTRSLALTDNGERFYREARIVLDAVAQAQASVSRSDNVIRGDVRVSLPPIQDEALLAMLARFANDYPEVRLLVDFSSRLVDLLREGYDVALRASSEMEPGLVARVVARHRVIAVASPEYLAKHGKPRTVRDLRKHRCLTGFARGELPRSSWSVGRTTIQVESAFSSNDVRLLREAAVRGVGIGLLPDLIIHEDVCSGRLVQVLEGSVEAHNRLAVVFTEREFLPTQVRAFVDALVEWASKSPYVMPPKHRAPAGRARASR